MPSRAGMAVRQRESAGPLSGLKPSRNAAAKTGSGYPLRGQLLHCGNCTICLRAGNRFAFDPAVPRLSALQISAQRPLEGIESRVAPFARKRAIYADRHRLASALTPDELTQRLGRGQSRPLDDALTTTPSRSAPGGQKANVPRRSRQDARLSLLRISSKRSLIYTTALLTGRRAKEMRTLQCVNDGSVKFDFCFHFRKREEP